MKTTLCALASIVLLSAPTPRPEEILYAPEDGTRIQRSFRSVVDFERTEVGFTVDGEEPELPEPEDLSVVSEERIVVTDEIHSTEDGRPTKLVRTFDEISDSTTYTSDAGEEEQTSTSDLIGRSVRFTWDEDEEEYTVEAEEEEEIDEDLLSDLIEDMDLRGLLPEDEVDEGDSWDLDADTYAKLMWPGGLLGFYDEESEEPDPARDPLSRLLTAGLDGEGEATLEEIREEDDVRLAVIAVELEVTSEAEIEMAEFFEEAGDAVRTIEISRKLEGTALWNLDAGHLESFEAEAESELVMTMSGTAFGPEGEEAQLLQSQTFEGTIKYEVTFDVL